MQAETIVRILTDVTGLLESTRGIHNILVKHQADAVKLIPVIGNLGEAEAALNAAEQAAPDLTAALKGYFGYMPNDTMGAKKVENFVRSMSGIGTMTPEQDSLWDSMRGNTSA